MTDPTQPTPVSTSDQEPGTITAEDLETLRGELASAEARRDRYLEAGYSEDSSEIRDVNAAVEVAEQRLAAAQEAFNAQGARSEEGAALAAIETPRTGSVPEDSADMVFTEEEAATAAAATEEGEDAPAAQETPQPEERASSQSSDNTTPPSVFQELTNQALYQDFLVFINGINVTRWVIGSVSYTLAGRGGTNNASFQLANPDNLFVLTPNEEAGGSDGGNIPPPSGSSDSITPNSLDWRTAETDTTQSDHPMYSEIVKKETYLRKALSPLQINETLGVIDQAGGGTAAAGNAVQVTRPGGNPREEAGFDVPNMERWPFGYYRSVFHKNDPVRIFVHNPFTPDDDSWVCAFTGYIQSYPIDDDWIMGNSTVNVSCYDLKSLMQKLRFQTNQVLHELPGNLAVDEGFFADFLRESEGGAAMHRLSNQTYENIVSYILTGRFLPEWFDGYQDQSNTNYVLASSSIMRERFGSIGMEATIQDIDPTTSPPTGFDSPQVSTGSGGRIERTTNGVGQVSMGSVFRFPGELSSTEDKANFIEEWHKLGLFGGFRRPLTYREALQIGSETKVDGENPPDRVNVHMLVPSMGSGLGTLEQIGIDTQTQEGRREFATRYDMLDGYSEKIDFQWWINGLGNIMVEMPMYDWFPSDFGEWEPVFTVDYHAISSNMGDESGDPPTAVIARGDQTGHTNIQAGASMDNWVPRLGIAWAPTMVHRFGLTQAELNLPFVTDPAVLRARALLELQKRLAEANQFSADFICRPLLTPNRPLYFKPRERIGWTQSVSNSLAVLGECTTQAELNYTRHRDINGHWRHITGGSFSALRYGQVVAGSGEGAGLAFPGSEESDSAENFPVTCNSAIEYTTTNRGEDSCETQPNSPTARASDIDSEEPYAQPRDSDAEEDPEDPEDAEKLMIYLSSSVDVSEFSIAGSRLARAVEADRESFSSAQDILNAIEERDNDTLSHFYLCAHGSGQWIGKGRSAPNRGTSGPYPQGLGVSLYYRRDFLPESMTLSTLVSALGPKLADNAIIGLCACSCGADPNESDSDRRLNGGSRSFAAQLRDGLVRGGKSVQVRAHTASGHCTQTAYCRVFSGSAGSAGLSVGVDTWGEDVITYERRIRTQDGGRYVNGNRAWSVRSMTVGGRQNTPGKFVGEPAERWMAGNPVDQEVIDQRPDIPE